MSSLDNASFWTKRIVIFTAIAIVGFIVLRFIITTSFSIYRKYFPPPPPAADQKYGSLSPISFENDGVKGNFEYTLDTSDGTLGHFTTVARVYPIERPAETLTSLSRAKERAKSLGFEGTPSKMGSNTYRWRQDGQSLDMDIQNNNFIIRTDTDILASYSSIPENKSLDFALSFIKNTAPTIAEFTSQNAQVKFYLPSGGEDLIETSSKGDAKINVVSFQRSVPDVFDVETPIIEEDDVRPLVSIGSSLGTAGDPVASEVNFYYWRINAIDFGIYPIKTVEQAFEELKAGKAHIVKKPNSDTKVDIGKIRLGYFLNKNLQDYLQPVYIFEGNGFRAIVEAIKK